MTASASTPGARTVRASLEEYGRGIAGGLLFSLPLLYTMEVWWAGFTVHPARLLVYVVVTFVLLIAYNRYAGLRDDANLAEAVIDSVEEMGIGILLSALILWILHRIHFQMPLGEIAGKVIIEAMTVAIGVSVGTAQLGVPTEDEGEEESGDSETEPTNFLEQTVIALCGAILIAANIGPTEEIVMLATESPPQKLLLIALFSLGITVLILNFSGFVGTDRFSSHGNVFEIARGAFMSYAVALAASALLCWFFGRFDGASLEIAVAQTVTLSFPAALGASAGRLLLQSNS